MDDDLESTPRAVVLGTGSIGIRHRRLLEGLGLEVGSVSRRAGVSEFRSVDEAVRSLQPGYVVVATATERHRASVEKLVDAGFVGRVLLEKPVMDRLGPFPRAGFRSIAVGYQLRFHPAVRFFRAAVVGQRVLSAQARYGQYLPDWRPTRDYRQTVTAGPAGGVLLELSHELDLMSWIFGPLSVCFGRAWSSGFFEMERDDLAVGVLETAAGGLIGFELNCHDRVQNRTFTVTTDSHFVRLDLIAGTVEVDGHEVFGDPVERDQVFTDMHRSVLAGGQEACTVDEALAVLSLTERLRGD